MTRRSTQIVVFSFIAVLIIAAVWYQVRNEGLYQTQVLSPYGGYYGLSSPVVTTSPQPLQPNVPNSLLQKDSLYELWYLVEYGELTVLDALQVSLVPSLSTEIRWVQDSQNSPQVVIDDDMSTRTAFIAPEQDANLIFSLEMKNSSGDYQKIAMFTFSVVSHLAFIADVNQDGRYTFQPDVVSLLRDWNSYGADAIRILAVVLSRLETTPVTTL